MCGEKKASVVVVLLFTVAMVLWLAGCASTGKPPSDVKCGADTEWQITPEAQVTQFDCEVGDHKGKPSLIFTAGVKNVTEKPLRYRLNIFLMDLDKAAGYLIPEKGKPPVVEPGNTQTVKIPFIGTSEQPKKVLVLLKTISID
jgi:hypothetical protein